jgi:hypothetical protein
MHRSDPRPETVKIPDSPGSFKPRSLDTTLAADAVMLGEFGRQRGG